MYHITQKLFSFFFFILVINLFFLSILHTVSASSGSFIMQLYYDHGHLSLIEDDASITPSATQYTEPTAKNYPLYRAELYDSSNKLLVASAIDQKENFGTVNGPAVSPDEGWVVISAPYDINASRILLKDATGQIVLNQVIYNNSCNRNNACEPQLNETVTSCPLDCAVKQQPATTSQNAPQTSTGLILLVVILVLGALATLIAIIILAVKNYKS